MSMRIFLDIHLSAHQFIVIDAQGELFPRVFELFSKTSTSRRYGKKTSEKIWNLKNFDKHRHIQPKEDNNSACGKTTIISRIKLRRAYFLISHILYYAKNILYYAKNGSKLGREISFFLPLFLVPLREPFLFGGP